MKRIISMSNQEIYEEWLKLKANLLSGKFRGATEGMIEEMFKNMEEGDKEILTAMSMAFTEGLLTAYDKAQKAYKEYSEKEVRYIG